jgi:hypothetical protein
MPRGLPVYSPMTFKEIAAPDGWELARKAFGLCVALGALVVAAVPAYHAIAVQPVAERVERIEVRQSQAERDRTEALQRLRGIEVQVDGVTRILRRIERKVDR